jgi:hypothetical protein
LYLVVPSGFRLVLYTHLLPIGFMSKGTWIGVWFSISVVPSLRFGFRRWSVNTSKVSFSSIAFHSSIVAFFYSSWLGPFMASL